MAAHARLKNAFTKDEKCNNLMSWLKCGWVYMVSFIETFLLSFPSWKRLNRLKNVYHLSHVMRKPVYAICHSKQSDQRLYCSLLRWYNTSSSKSEISNFYLASVAAQAGLCLTWSQTPKTGFLVTRLILYNQESYFIRIPVNSSQILLLLRQNLSFITFILSSIDFICALLHATLLTHEILQRMLLK